MIRTTTLLLLALTTAAPAALADFEEECTELVPGLVTRCDYSDAFAGRPRACGDERNVEYAGTTYYVDEPLTGGIAVDVGEWDETSGTTPYHSEMIWFGVGLGALEGDGVYGEVATFEDHCRQGDGAIVNLYTVGFWHHALATTAPNADAQSDLLP